jgi:hypothetical protein
MELWLLYMEDPYIPELALSTFDHQVVYEGVVMHSLNPDCKYLHLIWP